MENFVHSNFRPKTIKRKFLSKSANAEVTLPTVFHTLDKLPVRDLRIGLVKWIQAQPKVYDMTSIKGHYQLARVW